MRKTPSNRTAEALTLAEAVDQIFYGACCNVCHEVRRVDLRALMDSLGSDVLVEKIRPKLKCGKCGNKKIVVTTLWQSASTSERMTEHWK